MSEEEAAGQVVAAIAALIFGTTFLYLALPPCLLYPTCLALDFTLFVYVCHLLAHIPD